jgi:hypothetical protein
MSEFKVGQKVWVLAGSTPIKAKVLEVPDPSSNSSVHKLMAFYKSGETNAHWPRNRIFKSRQAAREHVWYGTSKENKLDRLSRVAKHHAKKNARKKVAKKPKKRKPNNGQPTKTTKGLRRIADVCGVRQQLDMTVGVENKLELLAQVIETARDQAKVSVEGLKEQVRKANAEIESCMSNIRQLGNEKAAIADDLASTAHLVEELTATLKATRESNEEQIKVETAELKQLVLMQQIRIDELACHRMMLMAKAGLVTVDRKEKKGDG